MGEERLVNLVLVSLESEDAAERQSFIQKMARGFSIPPEQIEKILTALPFTLSRKCTLDQARVMAEKVQEAGGICRLADPEEEPESPPAPKPAAEQPVPEPTLEQELEQPVPASEATIPLATSGGGIPLSPSGGGGGAAAANSVRCIECGEVQPKGGDSCRNCYYPLPAK